MTKLTYRTTGDNGIEWQALGDDMEPLGPWRPDQPTARKDFPVSVSVPQPDGYSTEECNIPPRGWWCSRGKGHEGPCAARSTEDMNDAYRGY